MHAERLFFLCNSLAPIGWLMLIVAPRWKWTERLVLSGLLPLLLGLVYLVIIAFEFWNAEGDFGSHAGVAKLFENPYILTAAWIHYLAFDMFIGAWEIRDSRKYNISHLIIIPSLFLTFLFGPVGLILYFVTRWIKTGNMFVHD